MVEHDQLPRLRIACVHSYFSAHEQRTGVVPHAVGIGRAVDEGIERSVGDQADVDR